jgi:hypothetical protein
MGQAGDFCKANGSIVELVKHCPVTPQTPTLNNVGTTLRVTA